MYINKKHKVWWLVVLGREHKPRKGFRLGTHTEKIRNLNRGNRAVESVSHVFGTRFSAENVFVVRGVFNRKRGLLPSVCGPRLFVPSCESFRSERRKKKKVVRVLGPSEDPRFLGFFNF